MKTRNRSKYSENFFCLKEKMLILKFDKKDKKVKKTYKKIKIKQKSSQLWNGNKGDNNKWSKKCSGHKKRGKNWFNKCRD